MVGIAMTCWFITEVVGETYNVQLGLISDVAFNFVWIFYGTTIVCLALSGYSWTPRDPRPRAQRLSEDFCASYRRELATKAEPPRSAGPATSPGDVRRPGDREQRIAAVAVDRLEELPFVGLDVLARCPGSRSARRGRCRRRSPDRSRGRRRPRRRSGPPPAAREWVGAPLSATPSGCARSSAAPPDGPSVRRTGGGGAAGTF